MKKIKTSMLLIFLMCITLSVTAFASEGASRLYDGADLLTDAEESSLLNKLDSVSEKHQVDFVIASVETAGNLTSDQYVKAFYEDNGYGYGADRDGVILLLVMEERDYRIYSKGLGAKAISDKDIKNIGSKIASSLTAENYADAFNDFVDECEYQVNGEINGFSFDFTKNLMISLAIGFVTAFIATGIMKGQLKSVSKQFAATEYTKQGSMKVTTKNDLFLYRSVDRYKKETSSSSSSGSSSSGSSGNVGGGKF